MDGKTKYMMVMPTKQLQEVVTILTAHFSSEIHIKSVVRLSKPERRNLILRIILQSPPRGVPETIILKQSHLEKDSVDNKEVLERFARDWAGLEFLTNLNSEPTIAPKFYGGSQKYRVVLLEDLGEVHFSLVDSLTGNDKNTAIAALTRYMQLLGKFHANGYGKTDEYTKIVQKLNPSAETWQDELKTSLDEILPKASSMLGKLAILYSTDLKMEISDIFKSAKGLGKFTTYIHGDICPDNVFDNPQNIRMHLIDFEWGMIRNALLDGTYLRMSMPTCWCVKAFPDDVIEPLEAIYRQQLIKTIPAASDNNLYNEAYVSACAYWIITLISYSIEDILDKEHDIFNSEFSNPHPNWKTEYNLGRSRCLSRLQAFIDISSKHKKLPHVRVMAENVLKELKIRWPEAKPLELFTAFREM